LSKIDRRQVDGHRRGGDHQEHGVGAVATLEPTPPPRIAEDPCDSRKLGMIGLSDLLARSISGFMGAVLLRVWARSGTLQRARAGRWFSVILS
jgi:hypothetical protein